MPRRKHNQNTLALGQWNAICDVCGMKFKSGDLEERWDGMMVCKSDYEERHIADFFKVEGKEESSVPWARQDSDADSSWTDVSGESGSTDITPEIWGNENVTFIYGTDGHNIHIFNTTLTGARRINFFNSDGIAEHGDGIIVYKNCTGGLLRIAYQSLTIRDIPADVTARIELVYDDTLGFIERSYTTIGL